MDRRHRVYHQYSRHLTGAILPDDIEFYRQYPLLAKRRYPHIHHEWYKDISTGKVGGVTIAPWLEMLILEREPLLSHEFTNDWTLIWDAVIESLNIQISAITHKLSHSDLGVFLTWLRKMQASPYLMGLGKTKVYIINIHEEIEAAAARGERAFRIPSVPDIEITGNLVTLHSFPGGPILIPYQFLANTLDKLEGQFSHQFYVLYMSQHPSREGLASEDLFQRIYSLLEKAYREVGNDAIRITKLLEPLLVGAVLQSLDPVTNDHVFGEVTRMSLLEDFPRLHAYVQELWDIAKTYLRRHGVAGIPVLIEQFGQEKLHNYPIVSSEEGLKKMYRYGTETRYSNDQAIQDLAANFKREYLVAYYEKHGVLPKAMQHFRMDYRIRAIYDLGRPGSIRECMNIPLSAWASLEYEKNHDFNYYPQVSDLLDDKAITPHMSHIFQLFTRDALTVIGASKPRDPENTRLILEILDREIIDIREFYRVVEEMGHIPQNWAVIQCMAKEKELKIEARAFSILTFECRMMASACERNLKEHILPLFRPQSMTISGSELKHKMDVLTTLPETPDEIWVVFHHDLKQWNYTFRSYQQSYFINVLCTLFGVNHYQYLMNIFTDSLLISANKNAPPGFPGVFTQWSNHAGRNQGILQSLWTLMTLVLICSVMREFDYDFRLTGSGDNQVLWVRLRKSEQLPAEIQRIKTALKQRFEDIGLELKEVETWTSSELVCYQRKYYFRGVLIPGGIKLAARAFSGTGDISTGVNATVTTGMNGGIGLTDQHSDPVLGPAFAYTEVLLSLVGNKRWKPHITLESQSLTLLTFLSSDFGYLPFIQLPGFLYAGHQDTLTELISLLEFVWKHYPSYRPKLTGIAGFRIGRQDAASRLQLVLEPTALNIDRPRLPEALVMEQVEAFLTDPTHVRNVQLTTMFACSSKDDQLRLADELLKIRPINVALIHSLFEYSHIGSLLGTLSRFNKISSLVRMVGLNTVGTSEKNLTQQVKDMDARNLRYFFNRMRPQAVVSSSFINALVSPFPAEYALFCTAHNLQLDCSFSVRMFLISKPYDLGMEMVTGPYTPSPLEQLEFHDTGIAVDVNSALIISPSYNIPNQLDQLELSRGPYALYIGSRTADPIRSIKLTTLDGVEAGTAIKTLLKMLAWMKSTSSDPNVVHFITKQLSSRMEGLDSLIPGLVPGTAGGCIDHRFGSPGTVMWAFSSSTTVISTWYQISSNRATTLQRGEEDRFVFFQQLYHHIYGALRFCQPYHNRFSVSIRLDHCSYPIPEVLFTSPPLYLPGLERLHDGLVLDETRKVALLAEAIKQRKEHEKLVRKQKRQEEAVKNLEEQRILKSSGRYAELIENLDRVNKQLETERQEAVRKAEELEELIDQGKKEIEILKTEKTALSRRVTELEEILIKFRKEEENKQREFEKELGIHVFKIVPKNRF